MICTYIYKNNINQRIRIVIIIKIVIIINDNNNDNNSKNNINNNFRKNKGSLTSLNKVVIIQYMYLSTKCSKFSV